MLPINGKLHNDLSQLQGDLNVLFDSKSTHKLLYSLKIFEEMKFQNNQDGYSLGARKCMLEIFQSFC